MLVLSRERDDEIVITTPDGIEISVMVIDIRGHRVRLGVEAPVDFKIHRGELLLEIKRELAMRSE